MAIDYRFHNDDGLLCVAVSGRDESLDEAQRYGQAIIKSARELNCTKILCDERKRIYNLSTLETFESARFLAQQAPNICKVAIVAHPAHLDETNFWVTVAANRGLQVSCFTDYEEGKIWLMEKIYHS